MQRHHFCPLSEGEKLSSDSHSWVGEHVRKQPQILEGTNDAHAFLEVTGDFQGDA